MIESIIIFTIGFTIFITFQLIFAFLSGRYLRNSLDTQTLLRILKGEVGTSYDKFVIKFYGFIRWRVR